MVASLKPGNALCAIQRQPSAFCCIDEPPGRFDRAIIVQIVVPPFGKPHELFRLMGERKQTLAKDNRYCDVSAAVHEQERRFHPRDALVGTKSIPHHETYREERKHRRSNVSNRRVGRLQDQLADRLFRSQRHRHAAAERKAPDDNAVRVDREVVKA